MNVEYILSEYIKYGTGPPQQEKMTKYTGPTQDLLTQKSSKYGTGTPQQEKMT